MKLYTPKSKLKHKINFDIVSDRLTPILGAEAVQSMGLITLHDDCYESLATIKLTLHTKQDYLRMYQDVFDPPVDTLARPVTLTVDPSVKPTDLPARQIAVSLREPMKKDLQRLQDLDVISRITIPTEWVSQPVCVDRATALSDCALILAPSMKHSSLNTTNSQLSMNYCLTLQDLRFSPNVT